VKKLKLSIGVDSEGDPRIALMDRTSGEFIASLGWITEDGGDERREFLANRDCDQDHIEWMGYEWPFDGAENPLRNVEGIAHD